MFKSAKRAVGKAEAFLFLIKVAFTIGTYGGCPQSLSIKLDCFFFTEEPPIIVDMSRISYFLFT